MEDDVIKAIADYMQKDVQTFKTIASDNSVAIARLEEKMSITWELARETKQAVKDGNEEMHRIVKDHMTEEDAANEEQNKRMARLEAFIDKIESLINILVWLVKHWKSTLIGVFFIAFLVMPFTFGFVLPSFAQAIHEYTNGAIDLTGLVSLFFLPNS